MAARIPLKQLRQEAPKWVFPWRPVKESRMHRILALGLVTAVFAIWNSGVRIRVLPPPPWVARKAAVIHVTDDAVSRELMLQAREGGPFPTRFEPATWAGAAAMEQDGMMAARWTAPPYVPALGTLPEHPLRPPPLAAAGQAVLPLRQPAPAVAPALAQPLVAAPQLYPLSGIRADELPRELPPFAAAGQAAASAETWRFLIRLDEAGHVQDCVSLAGDDEAARVPLEAWLRQLVFRPEPANSSRWIAIGVNWINQAATHGTDAR